jgi:hypothetical protein
MLGCYDFCAHYEWTFEWIRREGGEELVHAYWDEAIHRDSQRHARELILPKGIEGMKEYWGHTLAEEGADYTTAAVDGVFRLDMHQCPSKGFLVDNNLEQYHDYCDHCIGWIGPMMKEAGFVVHHQHNHRGQCWWEFHPSDQAAAPSAPGGLAGNQDARLATTWKEIGTPIDAFMAASSAREKEPVRQTGLRAEEGST